MRRRLILALLAVGGAGVSLATPLRAQLIFATDRADAPQYLIDVGLDRSYQVLSPWLYGGGGTWGMTADNELGVLYCSNAEGLFRIEHTSLRPQYLGVIHVDGEPAPMVGLAWQGDAQVLYGAAIYPQPGVYEIDLVTLQATLAMPIDPAHHVGGLEYDNLTQSLLALFDGTGANGGALYSIDLAQQQYTFVTGYPNQNVTDIDGLAAGDGRAYLVSDREVPIRVYDLVARQYLAELTSPVTSTNLMCGAAWAPSFMQRLLVSEPIPGRVGRNNRFYIVGARPLSTVHLVAGWALGSTGVPGCSGSVIEIAAPRVVGTTTTDAAGAGHIGFYVPTQVFGRQVLFQVADQASCELSNLSFFDFGPE